MDQQLRLCAPNAGSLGSIPGQGTRFPMPQLKISDPQAATKTQHSQINKYFLKKRILLKVIIIWTQLFNFCLLFHTQDTNM